MNPFEKALRDFHTAYEQDINNAPITPIPDDLRDFRETLIDEEYKEFKDATRSGNVADIAKEGIDLLYVVLGTLVSYGVPITAVFEEVHRSNMSKLGPDGKPIKREDGKALKGPDYKPADVWQVLIDHEKKMIWEKLHETTQDDVAKSGPFFSLPKTIPDPHWDITCSNDTPGIDPPDLSDPESINAWIQAWEQKRFHISPELEREQNQMLQAAYEFDQRSSLQETNDETMG